MGKQKLNGKRIMVFAGEVTLMLALAIVLPVSAQQQQGQQRQGGLDLEAAPGLPAPCTTAVYMQEGGEEINAGKTYSSTKSGVIESTICVKNGGWLTLRSPKITKTGTEGGDYGGQAVEASNHSVVNILNGEIYTDTRMANALYATNEGSLIYMKGGSIHTIASGGHGVDVTKRGSVILYDVEISTEGQSASGALVNDAGDGTIYAYKVRAKTKGPGSSGFYMIGSMSMLTLMNSSLDIETSEIGVLVHGSNVSITDTTMKGGGKGGIKVAGGTLSISGGSLTVTNGPAFYIGGGEGGIPSGDSQGGRSGGAPGGMPGGGPPGGMPEGGMPGGGPPGGMPQGGMPGGGPPGGMPEGGMPQGGDMPGGGGMMGGLMPFADDTDNTVTIEGGTKISVSKGTLINHADDCKCTFNMNSTDLEGDIIVEAEDGELTVSLSNSNLTSKIDGAALSLGRNSTWNVTGDSDLTTLKNADISGNNITNIKGNGHTVFYDKELNDSLGGKTYTLANGGKLIPKK
jgi:hypothetical protein